MLRPGCGHHCGSGQLVEAAAAVVAAAEAAVVAHLLGQAGAGVGGVAAALLQRILARMTVMIQLEAGQAWKKQTGPCLNPYVFGFVLWDATVSPSFVTC